MGGGGAIANNTTHVSKRQQGRCSSEMIEVFHLTIAKVISRRRQMNEIYYQ
jgi:hypothetical protein